MTIELAVTGAIALAVFAGTLAIVVLLVDVLRSNNRAGGPDEADPGPDEGGGGGSGLRRPEPPSDPGGEPDWWPEFELQLAEYVTRQATRPS